LPRYRFQLEMGAEISDEKAKEVCNNIGPGAKPKTDIDIEKRPSRWPGMAVYTFTYDAPAPRRGGG
jgi:hypothetical protein